MAKGVIFALLAFALIFSISSASAGLVLNGTDYVVTKTVGVPFSIPISITNTEGYAFYNLSFEDNPYITFSPIATLPSGSTAVINASVIGDGSANVSLRLKGYYIVTVGQNPQTFDVNITSYVSVPDPCDFSITKGDSVKWSVAPNLLQNIELRQAPYASGINTVTTMLPNTTYLQGFPNALEYKYRFYVGGFSPGECKITVLEDSGPVNNPQLDAILHLQLNTTYQPTALNLTVLTTQYNMDFFTTQDGVMSITNTGGNTAYGVHLSGDWLTFNANDFNLGAGESKGIIFTIRPSITQTNQTNKTYTKPITISGNFPTLQADLSIGIKYAAISLNFSSESDFDYFNRTFCPQFPNSIFCNPDPKVVYKYINNASEMEVNVSVTQAKLDAIWLFMFSLGDDLKTMENFVKQQSAQQAQDIRNITDNLNNVTDLTSQNYVSGKETRSGIIAIIIIAFLAMAILATGALIFVYRKYNAEARLRRMGTT